MIVCVVPRPTKRADGLYTPPESVRAKDQIEVLTANEYQQHALRTAGEHTGKDLLINGVMGLAGESGECIDMVKKHLFQGHPLDTTKLAKELGDVAWYLAVTAHSIGFKLEDVLQVNIDKLKARYPEGFDPEKSLYRKEGDV